MTFHAFDETLIDVGLKDTVSAGSLNIGIERLVRTERSSVRRSRPTWRLVATFDYRVSRDVSLSTSFGKDYRDAGIRQRNIVVWILGVNLGFGDRPDLVLRSRYAACADAHSAKDLVGRADLVVCRAAPVSAARRSKSRHR